MAAPTSTIMVANKDETGSRRAGGRKNSTLTSKCEVYAHFTPKEQVQTEKQAGNLDSIK